MKVFTESYRRESAFPTSYNSYFGCMKYCVLDIETTGLSRTNNKVILIGLLTETDDGIRVTQFLAENHYEERKVLDAFIEFMDDEAVDYIVTYNGLSFDVPFINARLEHAFMDDVIRMYHLDLYRLIKSGTDLASRLPSLKQMAVEDYYGIFSDRDDTISGRESVAMFDEYSLSSNPVLEKTILTHNREDVLQLHRLIHLITSDIEDFDIAIASYGFPAMKGRYCVRPFIKDGRGRAAPVLRITGEQLKTPFSAAYFPDAESSITATFNASSSSFEIEVPIEKAPDSVEGPSYYIDAGALGLDYSALPDYVNGYLILTPDNINMLSRDILARYSE